MGSRSYLQRCSGRDSQALRRHSDRSECTGSASADRTAWKLTVRAAMTNVIKPAIAKELPGEQGGLHPSRVDTRGACSVLDFGKSEPRAGRSR